MGGGSGGGGTTTTSTQPGPPQVIPQLAPYATLVGQKAVETLNNPNLALTNYIPGPQLGVAGLQPLQQLAGQQIADRALYGIPTSPGAGMAYGALGGNDFRQFIDAPNLGNSAAVQAARQGLDSEIIPQVQNAAAQAGLAQSTFMPQQIGRAVAQQMVPLYQQGLNLQATMANNQVAPELALGSTYDTNANNAISQAMQFGQLQQNIQQAQYQSAYDQFLRNLQIALQWNAPTQNWGSVAPGASTSTSKTSANGGGWSLGK